MRKAQFDQLTAASFCRQNLAVLEASRTVQEALELLSAENRDLTIAVSGEKGKIVGCLSVETLMLHLFGSCISELDNGTIPAELETRLAVPVGVLPLEPPVWVDQTDPLPILLLRARQDCSEWLLVRAEPGQEQAMGMIYLSELYQTAANLALSTEKAALPFVAAGSQPAGQAEKAAAAAAKSAAPKVRAPSTTVTKTAKPATENRKRPKKP